MKVRENPWGSLTSGGAGPFETPREASNDLRSLDERYRELLDAYHFWKYMPRFRIAAMSFAQRVILRDMRERVCRFERETGVTI